MSSAVSKPLLSLDLRFGAMDIASVASRPGLSSTEKGFCVRDRLTRSVVYVEEEALIKYVTKYDVTRKEAEEWLAAVPKSHRGYEVKSLPEFVSDQYTRLSLTLPTWFSGLDKTKTHTYAVDLLQRFSISTGTPYLGIAGLHERTVIKFHKKAIYCLADQKGDKILGRGNFKTVVRSFEALTGKVHAAAFTAGFPQLKIAQDLVLRYQKATQLRGCLPLRDVVILKDAEDQFRVGLFLKYCQQGSLTQLLPHLKPDEKSEAFRTLIEAVSDLHAARWVHGDLKPDNILVSEKKGKLRFWVSDFDGMLPPDLRVQGFTGTPYYFSPERAIQALHSNYQTTHFALDMWALGAILTQLFTQKTLPLWANPGSSESTTQFFIRMKKTCLLPHLLAEPPTDTPAHLVWQMLDLDASTRLSASAAEKALANLKFDDKTWDYQFRLYAPTPAPTEASTAAAASAAPSPQAHLSPLPAFIKGRFDSAPPEGEMPRTPLPAPSPAAGAASPPPVLDAFPQGVLRLVPFPVKQWQTPAPPPSPAGAEGIDAAAAVSQ